MMRLIVAGLILCGGLMGASDFDEALADRLRQAGLASIKSEHYEGGHWLGSFAVYLVSGRGLK